MTFSDNVLPYQKKTEDNVLKFCTVDTLSNICNEGDLSLYLPSSWAFYIFLSFRVCDFRDGLSKVLYFTRVLHDSCLPASKLDAFIYVWMVSYIPEIIMFSICLWTSLLFYCFGFVCSFIFLINFYYFTKKKTKKSGQWFDTLHQSSGPWSWRYYEFIRSLLSGDIDISKWKEVPKFYLYYKKEQ